jgi:hypothetical protein
MYLVTARVCPSDRMYVGGITPPSYANAPVANRIRLRKRVMAQDKIRIELKAVIELDASVFMSLKRFMERADISEEPKDDQRRLRELSGHLNDYDLDA